VVARDLRGFRGQAPHRGSLLTNEQNTPESAPERADRILGKAYRPIPPDLRRAALEAGLSAYERGDFFEAHELLEPAWMGASDAAERALYQGLIKLSAGYVHAVRGNPIGVTRNLTGARAYLETSLRLDPSVARGAGIDLPLLLVRINARLTAVATVAETLVTARLPLIDLLPEAPQIR
jgi:predicted metal-dependent hydrolase